MLFFPLLLEVIWILAAEAGRYIWMPVCLSVLMSTCCPVCLTGGGGGIKGSLGA